MARTKSNGNKDSSANLGFEAKLCLTADKLSNNMDAVRWQFGAPPKGNANLAWVQHFIHHLAPHGMAGFVLANGSMSSSQSGEGNIHRALVEVDVVD